MVCLAVHCFDLDTVTVIFRQGGLIEQNLALLNVNT